MAGETDRRMAFEEDETLREQPLRRRRGRILMRAFLLLALLVIVGTAGLALRLSSKPLFTGFGTGTVADHIARELGPGSTVSVGVLGLSLDAGLNPVVHLRDLHVTTAAGDVASIDTLAIGTAWSAFVGGGPFVSSILADHVFIGVSPGDAPMPSFAAVLGGIDDAVKTTGVTHLEVDSLTLARQGATVDQEPVLDGVAASAEADGDTVSATLAGSGVRGSWSISAAITPGQAPGDRRMTLRTRGLDVADLAMMAGDSAPTLAGPVALEGSASFAADGSVSAADGAVVVGPLALRGADETPVLPEPSRLRLGYDDGGKVVTIEPSTVMLPGGHALVRGRLGLPSAADPRWIFRLAALGEESGQDGRRAEGNLAGSYDPSGHLLVIDQLSVEGVGTRFTSAMRLTHADSGIAAAVSGAFSELPVESLKSIWPAMLAPGARKWVVENVAAGTIRDTSLDLTFTSDGFGADARADASAGLDFRFDGLAFRSFDDGPMIRDATGTGRFAGDRFEISVASGVADLGDGRTLAVGPATFVIPNVVPDPPDGEVRLHVEGDGAAALALWQRIPLRARAELDIGPADVTGRAAADITLRMPLVADLKAEQVAYEGTIALRGLDLARPLNGRTVKDADLDIALGEGGARITGKAVIDGVRADIDLTEPLDDDDKPKSAVRLTLDEPARRKLGIDFGDMLAGPVLVSVSMDEGNEARQAITADLTRATLSIPSIGFSKPKGRAGTATFMLVKTPSGNRLEDIDVKIGNAVLQGSIALGKDGRLVSGAFDRVRFAPGDSLKLTMERDGNGYAVKLRGSALDGRALIRSQLKSAGGDGQGGGPDLAIEARVDAVTGFGDEALSGVNLSGRVTKGRLATLSVAAQTAGGGALSATLDPVGGQRRVTVEVGEVGRVLRFFDVYGRVFGGRATVTGMIDASGAMRAAIDGSRWKVVEEPALARLSTATADGPTAGLSTADINRLLADLTFADGRLTIDGGVVRAVTAGLSLQGDVDFGRDVLSLSGTYLPASAFDSLLGKIPILGQTVFAGGRAGLLGVSFRLTGPLDDPKLSVNPLSVIAPGIFRKLFELQ